MNHYQIEILENLSWESKSDQIKSGFVSALQETDHQYLLQPADYFCSWDNAAIVFLMLGDEEIEPYLLDLLKWLQDYNWPGAEWILKRLQRTSSKLLVEPLERSVKLAIECNDECWLGAISILIANPDMIELLDDDIFRLLKPFAAEYWGWNYDEVSKHTNLK